MNQRPTSLPLDTLADAAWQELTDLHARVADCYRRLAAAPAPYDLDEQTLLRLLPERDAAAERFGRIALRWHASGGELALYLPDGAEVEAEADAEAKAEAEVEVEVEAEPEAEAEVEAPQQAPPPPAPRPSAASLLTLKRHGLRARPITVPQPPSTPTAALPPVPRLTDLASALAELSTLETAVSTLDACLTAPKPVQRAHLEHLAARARALQDEAPVALPHDAAARLSRLFLAMTAWSSERRPGIAYGLQRTQRPQGATWRDDALASAAAYAPNTPTTPHAALATLRTALEGDVNLSRLETALHAVIGQGIAQSDPDLVEAVLPYAPLLHRSKNFKTLKGKVKAILQAEEVAEAQADRTTRVPTDWPGFAHTRGRAAVIVGGDRRTQASERFKEAFQLASVDWEAGLELRRIQTLAERVRSGKVELVVILARFCSHSAADALVDACKAVGTPFAFVPCGYGVRGVQEALERYLPRA